MAVLAPLALVNQNLTNIDNGGGFIENSLLMTVIIGMIVFCISISTPKVEPSVLQVMSVVLVLPLSCCLLLVN